MTTLKFLCSFLRKDFLEQASYRSNLFFRFFGIAVRCLIYYYLSKIVDTANLDFRRSFGNDYFSYFLLGRAMFQFAQAGLASFVGTCQREAVKGTLEALWLGRHSPFVLILSMGLWPFLNSLVDLLVFLMVGGMLSPLVFQKVSLAALCCSLILAFFVYASIGFILASVALVTKQGQELAGIFGSVNFVLAGVFFPVSLLPPFFRWISELLPMTHLLRLFRTGIYGFKVENLFGVSFFFPILFALVMYPLALLCLKWAILRVETQGSLSHV